MGVTIKDIAKEAHVSAMTVSRVVNNRSNGISDGKRQEIQELIDKMGYRPNALARGLVTKKTNVLGLILPNIVDPFFPEIARGVQDAAGRRDYNVILCNTDDKLSEERAAMALLREKCVDGILFYSSGFHLREEWLWRLLVEENDTPAALIGNCYDRLNLPSVYVDYCKGMQTMTQFLLGKGHRRIAYIAGLTADPASDQGLAGYRFALEASGISLNPALVCRGGFTLEGAREQLGAMLDQGLCPTAVLAENDMMALGALEALRVRNWAVPAQVSVASMDNTILGRFTTPSLTTLDLPKYEMGFQAACRLVESINHESTCELCLELDCRIIQRDSTAHCLEDTR